MLIQLLELNSLVFLAAAKRGQISVGFIVVCIAIVLTIALAVGRLLLHAQSATIGRRAIPQPPFVSSAALINSLALRAH